MAAHVAEWKFNEVKQITDLITKNKVIGIVQVGGIPAPQMQQMRKNLHGVATIRSAKNSLLNLALDEAEKQMKGISSLKELVNGQAAIITTDMNPFKLFAKIKESRANAPAKGGEKLSYDIEIKAGDTPFKPGPIVGELQKVGIPAAIQDGKVVIKTDKVIVPAGEKIKPDVAKMLARLEIFPIEIGIGLNGVYENGTVFKPDVLDVNIEEFIGKISLASGNAFILALELGWTNKQTIQPLIMKAYNNALVVAIEQGIVNK
ncbi:MAG: 50S ribosomal protein L10, partial [Candidatus Thermoplasmatota archaeon]|nr:50S ribosomal protein L10 [Candidatus Thermoplasmatota archaeon]